MQTLGVDHPQALTSKVWLEQILAGTQQGVSEEPVNAAQQQVIGVHQVITDGREVACKWMTIMMFSTTDKAQQERT